MWLFHAHKDPHSHSCLSHREMVTEERRHSVGVLTLDWSWGSKPLQPNGCAWYRCWLPIKELEKENWAVGMGFPGFHPDRGYGIVLQNKKAIHGWDVLIFKLLMDKRVEEHMEEGKKLGQKIVVDIDDWFDGLEETNRAYQATDPLNNPDNNREIYARIIDQADAVITSTPFLYDIYSKKRKNVYLVRNGIDVDRWKKRKDRAKWRPTVGWVGATPWRSRDLEQLSSFIGSYLVLNKLKFHHSGHTLKAPLASDQLEIPKSICSTSPLITILEYPRLFQKIDIGIVPLNDVPFNHAKSFIKGLEYAAAGVPFIASNNPEYNYLADHGVGRVASTSGEWIHHLEELRDPVKRANDVEENYEKLKQFTMDARRQDWVEVLSEIIAL